MELIKTLFSVLSSGVFENLTLCLVSAGCALVFIIADMVSGLYYNIALDGAEFDKNKLLAPFAKIIIVLFVIVIMSTGLTVVGNFINYLGWSEAELFLNYVSNLGIIATFLFMAAKRGVNAFEKLLKITGVSIEDLQNFINKRAIVKVNEEQKQIVIHELENEQIEDQQEILG